MPLFDNLKAKAEEVFNKAVEKAKKTLFDTVVKEVKSYTSSLLSTGADSASSILDKIKKLKDAVKSATKIFSLAVSAAEVVKAATLGIKEALVELARQAAKQFKNSKLNTDGIEISVGESKKSEVLAYVDPVIKPTNSATGLYLKFAGAKVKLNSIEELTKVATAVNKRLDSEDAETTRTWVHKIAKTHPLLDENIKNLKYFEPISEEVGSTYLLHTPDTQTLALEDWTTEIPKPIRNVVSFKMDENVYNTINNSYFNLNKAMANNISTEFYDQRKDVNNNILSKTIYSNDFHIAGDYSFALEHIGLLEDVLMTALINYIGSAGKLINWLVPINSYENAYGGGIKISVEGTDVVVDLKGNKVGVIATIIDETPITPIEKKS